MKIFRCGTCHKHFPMELFVNKWTVNWCPECKTWRRLYFVRNDQVAIIHHETVYRMRLARK